MNTDHTPIVYGCADCGVLRHKPHRITCRNYRSGEFQLRAYRAAVDPVVTGEINGKRFVAPLNSGTQIRKAIKDFTRATQMQLTVAA